jgi:hypothetical protein
LIRRVINKLRRLLFGIINSKIYIANKNNRSLSDNGLYVSFVLKALNDPKVFSTFKRHPIYTQILGEDVEEDGRAELNVIERKYPDYIQKFSEFAENDLIGNPKTFKYDDYEEISANTLRYIKTAGNIVEIFGNLDGFKIAEIGGGMVVYV